MRLVIISTYPPKHCGIGIYTKNLVEALVRLGIYVEVISFVGYDYKEEHVKPILKKNNLFSYLKAIKYISKNNFDKILIQHEYTFYKVLYFPIFLFLIRTIRKKINITMHTLPPYNDLIKANIFRFINSSILLFADKIILHTNYAKNRLGELSLIKKPITIIRIPINSRKAKKKILKVNDEKTNILCFGFLSYDKGFDIACMALGGLQRIQLNIVGSLHPSAMKKQMESIKALEKYSEIYTNIKFSNIFISEDEKGELFMRNDFILLPYRFIVQSATLTEAWSYCKIPICSDLLPLKEEIENDKYGVLFKNGDVKDLQEKILDLINDKKKQSNILKNIITLNKERGFDKISKEYLTTIV